VDLEQKELRLPDSKTGAKTVHLGDARKFQIAWLWRYWAGSNANKGRRSRMLIENQDDETAAA